MNTRIAIVIALSVGLGALVVFDLRTRQALTAINTDREQVAARLTALTRENRTLDREMEAVRARREALRKPAPTKAHAAPAQAEAKKNAEGGSGQATAIANNDELRKLRVQAFVGEERLKYTGLLHQLKLTPEQLRRFDEIAAEYQEAALDLVSTAKAQGIANPHDLAPLRRQVAETRDARLQELFGDNYEAWQEANRMQGAQATVDELLEQTFQSGGSLDPTQSQALVGIVKRRAESNATTGYDWDGIGSDAATVLSGPKLEALRTALTQRTLAEQMSAVEGGRR